VRDDKDVFTGIPSPRIPKEMIDLASHILDTKAGRFDASQFKDEYELALRKLVKRKAAGKTIEPPAERSDRGNVIDLMEALRQSVKGRKAAALSTRSNSKKSAPARKRRSKSVRSRGRKRKAA
jgi:DNA end-binding protein Ku